MRFCLITTFYPPWNFGGDGLYVQRLAGALARRGHEVDVIHCRDSYRGPNADVTDVADEPGVTVHGLESRVGMLSPLATQQTGYPLFKTAKIRRILETRRFDVIHYHNISLVGGPMLLRLGEGIKLYTAHEHWLVCPTHVLFKFQREPCDTPECIRCMLHYRRPPQLWRYTTMLDTAMRHIDMLIAPSAFTLRRHAAAGLPVPMVELPGFVPDPEAVPAAPDDERPARPYFLFVGRIERLKGLHTCIPLFRRYAGADLVVAGDGDAERAARRLAADIPCVRFLGRVSQSRLGALYAKAIAVIMPSIGYEVFGQVILEAFAQRTPVIVRDLGPLPDIVATSGGGLVFRTDQELLDAMERLRTDRAYRDGLGDAGFRAYRARWTEAVHMERYLELVEAIRDRKSGGDAVPARALS